MSNNIRKKAKVIDLESERKRLRQKKKDQKNINQGSKNVSKWGLIFQFIVFILLISYFVQECS